ncbi:MAG: WG repeat-containing protein [Chloroflexia bacterium]|nr:WG repeat-containing protein [Chloroflexia bacterium]
MCFTDTIKTFGVVVDENSRFIAIDKGENVLFEVFRYDNGPDYFSEGLLRIVKNGKIGYANEQGKIVIEPQYDCAWPFANGKASVSNSCKVEKDGEHEIGQVKPGLKLIRKEMWLNKLSQAICVYTNLPDNSTLHERRLLKW